MEASWNILNMMNISLEIPQYIIHYEEKLPTCACLSLLGY